MTTEIPKPTPIREIDFSFFIRHYLSLVWKWKVWIVLAGPIVSGIALIYIFKFASLEPALAANVKKVDVGMILITPDTSSHMKKCRAKLPNS